MSAACKGEYYPVDPEKEAALKLSYGPVVRGIVIEAKPDGKGWLQPEGTTTRIFFRQNRIRAGALDHNLEPTWGSKSTGHGQKSLTEGEQVMMVVDEDLLGRPRAHVIVRLSEWERVRKLGEKIKAEKEI